MTGCTSWRLCTRRLWWTVGIMLWLVLSQTVAQRCPSPCQCSTAAEGLKVDCKDNELPTVPRNIPDNTAVLLLLRNGISRIPAGTFSRLARLQKLNLKYNQLTFLVADAFLGLNSLQDLDLSNNRITAIDVRTFRAVPALRKLNLSRNRIWHMTAETFTGLTSLHTLLLANNQLPTIGRGASQYIGCFEDTADDRDFPVSLTHRYSLSPASCVETCAAMGYRYAGLQDGIMCLCGHRFGKHAKLDESECGGGCSGGLPSGCGGNLRSAVWATGPPLFSNLPALDSITLHGNPWFCDCLQHGLVSFVNNRSSEQLGGSPTCAGPPAVQGTPLLNLTIADLQRQCATFPPPTNATPTAAPVTPPCAHPQKDMRYLRVMVAAIVGCFLIIMNLVLILVCVFLSRQSYRRATRYNRAVGSGRRINNFSRERKGAGLLPDLTYTQTSDVPDVESQHEENDEYDDYATVVDRLLREPPTPDTPLSPPYAVPFNAKVNNIRVDAPNNNADADRQKMVPGRSTFLPVHHFDSAGDITDSDTERSSPEGMNSDISPEQLTRNSNSGSLTNKPAFPTVCADDDHDYSEVLDATDAEDTETVTQTPREEVKEQNRTDNTEDHDYDDPPMEDLL
ncbi:leucine-rich repeat transmembrane neuronal protein 4-like [Branchiostoma lanceolatum]|uniref:leucine-rich repeat transmembrane neuronal protein 4-like n=1 Tax=Branchiostoma lanceolatum TaxID=7740 RepID=UPI00345283F1